MRVCPAQPQPPTTERASPSAPPQALPLLSPSPPPPHTQLSCSPHTTAPPQEKNTEDHHPQLQKPTASVVWRGVKGLRGQGLGQLRCCTRGCTPGTAAVRVWGYTAVAADQLCGVVLPLLEEEHGIKQLTCSCSCGVLFCVCVLGRRRVESNSTSGALCETPSTVLYLCASTAAVAVHLLSRVVGPTQTLSPTRPPTQDK